MVDIQIDPNEATEEQILEGLKLLEQKEVRKAKIASGEIKGPKAWSELSDEEKERRAYYSKRAAERTKLLSKKAIEAGLTVTDEEIDTSLSERGVFKPE